MEFNPDMVDPNAPSEPQAPPSSPRRQDGDTLAVRWLAELCGLPSGTVFPSLASALLDDAECAGPVAAYIAWWLRHAEAGSRFEQATRQLRDMPDAAVVPALRRMGYDGLLYRRHAEIVGHMFFQRHGHDLCAFAAWVGTGRRGGKSWATTSLDFVALASQVPGVARARVGGGNHPITRHFVSLLETHAPALGWRVSRDGWVDFSRSASDSA